MWFRNIQVFRLPQNWDCNPVSLEEQLSRHVLQSCSATDPLSVGWIPPREGGAFLHSVNRQWLLALGAEQKLLPASVVKQFVNERVRTIEETEGRRVGRRELRDLRETMTSELMPRAFIRKRTTCGWIDPVNGWLAIDAASPAKAEEFIEHLHKTVEGLPLRLIKLVQSPSAAMTGWIAGGEAPAGFTIDQDMELRSAENATVRYAKHALDGEEVRQHIADGKVVTKLGMTWGDKVSFLLNEKFEIKRLDFLDILKDESENQAENEDERFDIDFTLMTGEIAHLLDDLVGALGGEVDGGA